ncbi:methyltransferase domain-containing protein [Solihabitans fulvus]|uniref:Methyltransferase domain-containing protein n=1 Tax=Solihabitans fulvus TaxID=1892852 RepID=A0A5B2X0B2_9PSEU|nr:methyltransferase domain-containing protein [Solihabitans fulvus]KAA2256346.1 methyltransferase domain-containing protein [Solihabitans fulvus]
MSAPPPDGQRTATLKRHVAELFDRAAPTYDRVGVEFFSPHGTRLVELAEIKPGQRVLDLGFGRGACLFPAADAVGPTGRVVGIDISPTMLDRTSAEVAERGLSQVRLGLGDAERPDFPEGSFDTVTCGHVMSFLPSPAAAVAGAHRMLRPGGSFALSTLGRADADARWQPVFGAVVAYLPPDAFLPQAINQDAPIRGVPAWEAALRDAGFGSVRTVTERHRTRFASAEDWWAFGWSHGQRLVWEQIPEESLEPARHATFTALAEISGPNGCLTWDTDVHYTIGERT